MLGEVREEAEEAEVRWWWRMPSSAAYACPPPHPCILDQLARGLQKLLTFFQPY